MSYITDRVRHVHGLLAPFMPLAEFAATVLRPEALGFEHQSQFYEPIHFGIHVTGRSNNSRGCMRIAVPVHGNETNWMPMMKSRFARMINKPELAKQVEFRTVDGRKLDQFAVEELPHVGHLHAFANGKKITFPTMPAVATEYSSKKSDVLQKWINTVANHLPDLIGDQLAGLDGPGIDHAMQPKGPFETATQKYLMKSVPNWTEFVRIHNSNSPISITSDVATGVASHIASEVRVQMHQSLKAAQKEVIKHLKSMESKRIKARLGETEEHHETLFSNTDDAAHAAVDHGSDLFCRLGDDLVASPLFQHTMMDNLYSRPLPVSGCRWDTEPGYTPQLAPARGGGGGGGASPAPRPGPTGGGGGTTVVYQPPSDPFALGGVPLDNVVITVQRAEQVLQNGGSVQDILNLLNTMGNYTTRPINVNINNTTEKTQMDMLMRVAYSFNIRMNPDNYDTVEEFKLALANAIHEKHAPKDKDEDEDEDVPPPPPPYDTNSTKIVQELRVVLDASECGAIFEKNLAKFQWNINEQETTDLRNTLNYLEDVMGNDSKDPLEIAMDMEKIIQNYVAFDLGTKITSWFASFVADENNLPQRQRLTYLACRYFCVDVIAAGNGATNKKIIDFMKRVKMPQYRKIQEEWAKLIPAMIPVLEEQNKKAEAAIAQATQSEPTQNAVTKVHEAAKGATDTAAILQSAAASAPPPPPPPALVVTTEKPKEPGKKSFRGKDMFGDTQGETEVERTGSVSAAALLSVVLKKTETVGTRAKQSENMLSKALANKFGKNKNAYTINLFKADARDLIAEFEFSGNIKMDVLDRMLAKMKSTDRTFTFGGSFANILKQDEYQKLADILNIQYDNTWKNADFEKALWNAIVDDKDQIKSSINHHPLNALVHSTLEPAMGQYPAFYKMLHTKEDMSAEASYSGSVTDTYHTYHSLLGVPLDVVPGVFINCHGSPQMLKKKKKKNYPNYRYENNEAPLIEAPVMEMPELIPIRARSPVRGAGAVPKLVPIERRVRSRSPRSRSRRRRSRSPKYNKMEAALPELIPISEARLPKLVPLVSAPAATTPTRVYKSHHDFPDVQDIF